eukprot:TRINITY_DN31993_c0_g1_i1.p1 TRINITY_DN31993_c0_g1~~TRINITY_DN31993_c0_g1_i1.p1  ORF type:complete len:535 (-),score=86.20 TRINITY_DN31993_c0_g1_i1:66-1556(-)
MSGYGDAPTLPKAPASDVEFSKHRFDDSALSPSGKKAMRDGFGFEFMTEVQSKTMEPILNGSDLVVRAKTGAGKTLSFLLPAIERLVRRSDDVVKKDAIDIIVASPVRELSMQIFQEAQKLTGHYDDVKAVCMVGGTDWQEDLEALNAASAKTTLLIATPGRLQTHLNKTAGFSDRVKDTEILVLDEVDQLCSHIFMEATKEIIGFLPSVKQHLLFSATMSEDVTKLVNGTLKSEHIYVDMLGDADVSVPCQIDQTYSVIPTEDMTTALWKAIEAAKEQNCDSDPPKIVVIFMTGRIAAYYAEAFRKSKCSGLDVFEIHARLKQNKRTAESDRFRDATSGILFTSDVSSRGLDYPGVTDVVQMGAPHSKAEYIHRLGRTGRGGNNGRGILLLHEFERGFLEELKDLPLTQTDLAQAYYSRINHVMRNSGEGKQPGEASPASSGNGLSLLEIMREAKRFAASIGALDQDGKPPEITQENAVKMGVADIVDDSVNLVA